MSSIAALVTELTITISATAAELEATIRTHIPLSEAMEFTIDSLSVDGIVVIAPLLPNRNIHGTGFAGSLYSIAVLSGWALTTHILSEAGVDAELVVGKAEITYLAPVKEDILCRCHCGAEARAIFLQSLKAKGKGRLELEVTVGESAAARLKGIFFATLR
ncbi:MAG: thioesterase domain-containing protein [Gammaproteobacteria bacterium]|jgi:thioesterase domain-containing protein